MESNEIIVTSVDYANLIRRLTRKRHNVDLVKTQVLKLLYIVYGMYLAKTDKPLFTDDQLKAWPYGPVFPRVYRLYKKEPGMITRDVFDAINQKTDAVKIIFDVIDKRHSWTAYQLSKWSHEYQGPWYNTVYSKPGEARWGAPIEDEVVKTYFKTFVL